MLELFGLSLPPVLLLSIPFGVLVGILVGLGRLSSDNEIIAMRSAGVSTRIVVAPVLTFAFVAMLVSGACAVWLNPLAIRAEYKILNSVAAAQLTADVEPRVFEDQFTNDKTVLYVNDVKSETGPVAVWNGVFIADLTPPAERKTGLKDAQAGPGSHRGARSPRRARSEKQPHPADPEDYGTHEAPYHSIAPTGATVLQAQPQQQQRAKPFREMLTRELLRFHRQDARRIRRMASDARIELHRRFALPIACMMLAMVGIPLGTSSRKGGRSAGYVWAIFLAFFCYYLSYITLTSLARSHSMPVELASWLPNAAFVLAGIIMIARMEMPGRPRPARRGPAAAFAAWFYTVSHKRRIRPRIGRRRAACARGFPASRQLRAFELSFSTSSVTLFCFVTMVQVFTFFDLLGDIVKNHIPMSHVVHVSPVPDAEADLRHPADSVLVAVLVTFGVMTKNNEVTAFKACGISVRRLGLPVLLMSALLSIALFAFDYSLLPEPTRYRTPSSTRSKAARSRLICTRNGSGSSTNTASSTSSTSTRRKS